MTPWLSVTIPAFNEEARLPATLERILGYLRGRGRPFEVIVVNDGSVDRTGDVARAVPDVRLIEFSSNHGKGFAVRQGLLASLSSLWLFCDADLATPIEEVERLERAIDAGAELAIASRAHDEPGLDVDHAPHRRLLGRWFNRAVRWSLGLPYGDTQCGFKLMRAEALRTIVGRLETDGFAFDLELLLRARAQGLSVAEVPVRWRHQEGSKIRVVRDGLGMLLALRRIRRLVDATEVH